MHVLRAVLYVSVCVPVYPVCMGVSLLILSKLAQHPQSNSHLPATHPRYSLCLSLLLRHTGYRLLSYPPQASSPRIVRIVLT